MADKTIIRHPIHTFQTYISRDGHLPPPGKSWNARLSPRYQLFPDGGRRFSLAIYICIVWKGVVYLVYIRWAKINAPTLVIFKNIRYVIYITYLSMVGKINSLAFHPYPTFVILTTSMDTILKTVSVVILK